MKEPTIFVDANATYPVEASHYDKVIAVLKEFDGNPSSIHAVGRKAKVALEDARTAVARTLGARATELIFTSGATEANNLAIQGIMTRMVHQNPHLITLATEHSSVLEPARLLQARAQCDVSVLPVDSEGLVDQETILAALRPETVLVTVMHANNETGTIQPIEEIAAAVRARHQGVHIHVDAVQTLGKLDLTRLTKSPIDSIALSSHKIGGFKGVGALWLRTGSKLSALLAGGGQERGRRAGTENIPGIISFGMRSEVLAAEAAERMAHVLQLRNVWIDQLRKIPGAVVHGPALNDPAAIRSLPNTVNFHVEGVRGDDILLNFDLAGIYASSGSACSSGTARPSEVLLAMGYDEHIALNSVRISFWYGNRLEDLAKMNRILIETVARVRGH